MVKVRIVKSLFEQIKKKFKGEAHKVIDLIESLENNPKKGKPIGNVGNILIKELKYRSFRFYFIADGYKLKVLSAEKLKDLLIKFVRMSDKKSQQKTIDEIKNVLRSLGDEGF